MTIQAEYNAKLLATNAKLQIGFDLVIDGYTESLELMKNAPIEIPTTDMKRAIEGMMSAKAGVDDSFVLGLKFFRDLDKQIKTTYEYNPDGEHDE